MTKWCSVSRRVYDSLTFIHDVLRRSRLSCLRGVVCGLAVLLLSLSDKGRSGSQAVSQAGKS